MGNDSKKKTSAVEMIGIIAQNKELLEENQRLTTRGEHARAMLKMYDKHGDQSTFLILIDSLAEFFVNKLSDRSSMTREQVVDMKVLLGAELESKASEVIASCLPRK